MGSDEKVSNLSAAAPVAAACFSRLFPVRPRL